MPLTSVLFAAYGLTLQYIHTFSRESGQTNYTDKVQLPDTFKVTTFCFYFEKKLVNEIGK